MPSTERLDIRLTIDDPDLLLRFRDYLETWGNHRGLAEIVLRRALKEFLEREETRHRA